MAGSKSRISASTDAATDGVARVEIVTRGEVRREYTPEERAAVLTEAAMPGARVLLVAQRYGVSPSLVYRWRREAAGRPARQAPPRTPRFVPLLVGAMGYRRTWPCGQTVRSRTLVPAASRWCCPMAGCCASAPGRMRRRWRGWPRPSRHDQLACRRARAAGDAAG